MNVNYVLVLESVDMKRKVDRWTHNHNTMLKMKRKILCHC